MRWPLVVLGTALLLSGCSDSTSSKAPSAEETVSSPAPSASETASATTPDPGATPSSPSTAAEPTVDYMGESLVGLPDCNWDDLKLKPDGQEMVRAPNGEMTDTVLTNFVARNSAGHSCVIREAPQVDLLDSSKELMSPTFPETQPENALPWVLRDGFEVRLYFESPSVSTASMCPETSDYVKHVRLTFENGKVLNYPLDDGLYACPNTTPTIKTNMNMDIVQ
ncbi:hypothetical protein [Trueperella abortisuis]|uniref:hypothetical protein n=1 Tax=Trueperella abortisuis TaxID=445930 RepID=UPI0028935521|nr:hypothetical protein [Trueperella abortisuis]